MKTKKMNGLAMPCCASAMWLGLTLCTAGALAQTRPEAGTIQRSQPQAAPPALAPSAPSVSTASSAIANDGAITVKVSRFIIEGAKRFSDEELQAQLADLLGQPLTLAQLEGATGRIANYYNQRGFLIRVVLPAQDIKDGDIRITVIEGVLSSVRVEGGLDDKDLLLIGRVVTSRLKVGEPLTTDGLDRGLLVASDLPGVRAQGGVMEPGERVSETKLLVKVDPGQVFSHDVSYDNYGARATGEDELSLGVTYAPGEGRQFSLRLLASEGVASANFEFSTPVGYDGARFSLRYSDLRYKLIRNFTNLDAHGESQTLGTGISWPWLRSQSANLYLSAGLESKRLFDRVLGAVTNDKDVNLLNLTGRGDWLDGWGGGGSSDASLTYTTGYVHLGRLPSQLATDRLTTHVHGQFHKWVASASRQQRLTDVNTFYASGLMQIADSNLTAGEKLSLGGPTGVRGYPVSEASGDEALVVKLEFRRQLEQGWRGALFYDYGRIRQYRNPWNGWNTGSTVPVAYDLYSYGVTLSWSKPGDKLFELVLAAPDGPHPGKLANGRNQDGSVIEPRLWVRAVQYF